MELHYDCNKQNITHPLTVFGKRQHSFINRISNSLYTIWLRTCTYMPSNSM